MSNNPQINCEQVDVSIRQQSYNPVNVTREQSSPEHHAQSPFVAPAPITIVEELAQTAHTQTTRRATITLPTNQTSREIVSSRLRQDHPHSRSERSEHHRPERPPFTPPNPDCHGRTEEVHAEQRALPRHDHEEQPRQLVRSTTAPIHRARSPSQPNLPLHSSRRQSTSSEYPQRPRFRPAAYTNLDDIINSMAEEARSGPQRASPRRQSRLGEIVLPRWQPDSEVTICPICRSQFSIFVRKHHCRKCGRVVCNRCSPHRIVIPCQFIVRPPGQERPPSWQSNEHESFGGERVRLCNPCVPDPNITPPQAQGSPTARNSPRRNRSVTMNTSIQLSPTSSSRTQYGRILSGTPPAPRRGFFSSSTHQDEMFGGGTLFSMLSGTTMGASFSQSQAGSITAPSTAIGLPGRQRQEIPEEDECPVCHRELPSRQLPDADTLRESHISQCILAHSAVSGPPASADQEDDNASSSQTRPLSGLVEGGSAYRRRVTGMFPYLATEKDCIDSAECTICLEEFQVGVAMARLECLCRFHRHCILSWWGRHPGRCPVHQHDGFGL